MIRFIARKEAMSLMNRFSAEKIPFLFLVSFDQSRSAVMPLDAVPRQHLKFRIGEYSNLGTSEISEIPGFYTFDRHPVTYRQFKKAFDLVTGHIKYGNSFLTNLTFETPLTIDLTLAEIFRYSKARYKIWLEDTFCCFSPETFVKIRGKEISSYPMKGTIEADFPDAEEKILNDPKEQAEHVTIVDLIRNDLSIVADQVRVPDFRYIERLKTNRADLLQVSSRVSGILQDHYRQNIGDLLFSLLPAGSISGAPKPQTIDIINEAENHDRDFYTGICGVYDGENLDSGVMIRYVAQRGEEFYFKSGGGITHFSDPRSEYREYLNKVYLPL